MPTLRTWMVHHPNDWTGIETMLYVEDMVTTLATGMIPVVQIAGPIAAINIMLAVARLIGQKNPDAIDSILDSVLEWASELAKVEHPKGTMQ